MGWSGIIKFGETQNLENNIEMKLRMIFLAIGLLMLPSLAEAQCAMCRAVLESSENQSIAKGINDGIIYLMIFPYLAIGGIGFFIYRSYKKK